MKFCEWFDDFSISTVNHFSAPVIFMVVGNNKALQNFFDRGSFLGCYPRSGLSSSWNVSNLVISPAPCGDMLKYHVIRTLLNYLKNRGGARMKTGILLVVVGVILLCLGAFGVGWYYAAQPKLIQEHTLNKEYQVGMAIPTKFVAEKGNIIVIKGEGKGPDGQYVPVNIMIDGTSNIQISKNPDDFFYHVGRTPLMSPFEYQFKAPFTGKFEVDIEYWPEDLDEWPLKATIMATISVYDDSAKREGMVVSGAIAVVGFVLAIAGVIISRNESNEWDGRGRY